jgi:hypothetical protein
MEKQEVLSLLERFPDLVDSDELIQDLFREAVEPPASMAGDSDKSRRGDRSAAALQAAADSKPLSF